MASRTLEIRITGDEAGGKRALDATGSAADQLATKMDETGKKLQSAGLKLTASITLPVALLARAAFNELEQSGKVSAQTEAAIRSTGGAANVSAKQIDQLSTSLMHKSGMDDEAIKSGANLLLTFTQIQNRAGQGNDIFNQATKAAQNLSVAFGKDMTDSAILVGKALQDPIAGVTALRRVGVQLSDQQKEQIKNFVSTGDIMSAQKVILRELNTEVGGSAEAYGKTLAGQVSLAKEELRNTGATMIGVAAPAVRLLGSGVRDLAGWLSALPREAQIGIVGFLGFAASIGPVLTIVGSLSRATSVLITGATKIGSALVTAGLDVGIFIQSLMAMTAAEAAATAGVSLVVAGLATILVTGTHIGGNLTDGWDKARAAGDRWAQSQILAAKSTGNELLGLTARLGVLEQSWKDEAAAGDQSAAALIGQAERHKKLSGEIDRVKQSQKEAEAADKARRAGIDAVSKGTVDFSTATTDAITAITGMRDAELAVSGGQLGYQQSLLNITKAQKDYTDAVNQYGTDSPQAAAASLALQQAQLSGAQAAISATDAQDALKRKYQETPEALQPAIDKLVAEKKLHPEVADTIQLQIDKLNALKDSIDRLPTVKNFLFSTTVGGTRPRDDGSIESYDIGGVVPGPVGAPRLAIVHGGEEVLTPEQRGRGGGNTYVYVTVDPITGRSITRLLDEDASVGR